MPSFLAADGCRIHVDIGGDGPPLALIPGLGGSARFWDGVVEALSGSFRIMAFDHRGAGRSDRHRDGYSIENLAADIVAGLACFGISRAHVIGHSTGGAIAQALALDYPERVDRLVLSGSWARPDFRFRLLFETRLAVLEHCGPRNYAGLTQLLGYPAAWLEQHSAEVSQAIAAAELELADLEVARARIAMLLEFDRLDDLVRLQARTLVLTADDDMMIPPELARQLANAIPDARLELMSGGHFFPRVNAAAFAEVVASFLKAPACRG